MAMSGRDRPLGGATVATRAALIGTAVVSTVFSAIAIRLASLPDGGGSGESVHFFDFSVIFQSKCMKCGGKYLGTSPQTVWDCLL